MSGISKRRAIARRVSDESRQRRGAAAVELALLLPFLALVFLIVLDFGRVFYGALIADNCARNGAFHAGYTSNPTALHESPYASASAGAAAAADGTNIKLDPTTDVSSSKDDANGSVTVTATHEFSLITDGVALPNGGKVPRTIVMPQIPTASRGL